MRGLTGLLLIFSAVASADTINLRNGEVVQGNYLGGTARQIRIDVNGSIQTYDIGQVQSVTFDDPAYPPPPPAGSFSAPGTGYNTGSGNNPQGEGPAPASPGAAIAGVVAPGVVVPIDTRVTVRMIDAVNSETAYLGQTFRAGLDEPVFVNGQQVAPRGADVLTKLVQDQQSGKIEGRTVLTLALVSINFNGQPIPVTSTDVTTESSSRGTRSAGVVGGGTALGAIVGALAGGGKGAAIGAVSGAAIGGGAEVLTKGQTVKIPSETRLTFRLQAPVQL
jgi:hypothetical protein